MVNISCRPAVIVSRLPLHFHSHPSSLFLICWFWVFGFWFSLPTSSFARATDHTHTYLCTCVLLSELVGFSMFCFAHLICDGVVGCGTLCWCAQRDTYEIHGNINFMAILLLINFSNFFPLSPCRTTHSHTYIFVCVRIVDRCAAHVACWPVLVLVLL